MVVATPGIFLILGLFERGGKPSARPLKGIVAGILREAIKNTFKNQLLPELGPLWQDYVSFTHAPPMAGAGDLLFCRRFTTQAALGRHS